MSRYEMDSDFEFDMDNEIGYGDIWFGDLKCNPYPDTEEPIFKNFLSSCCPNEDVKSPSDPIVTGLVIGIVALGAAILLSRK